MNEKSKKILKTTTILKLKENHPWLYFTDKNALICTICCSQEEKLDLIPFARMVFIKYKLQTFNSKRPQEY